MTIGPTGVAFEGLTNTAIDWFDDAACRGVDVELFFAPRGLQHDRNTYREARQYCARCPVRAECLDYAIDNHIMQGFFGGKSERERRLIRHERRLR